MPQTLKLDILVDDHGGVKVLKDVQGQIDKVVGSAPEVAKAGGQMTSWLGAATPLLRSFGIVMGGVELVRFGRALLDDADALVKMHDKTGLSIEALQQFRAVGKDTGTTIDSITLAVNQMQNRLAGGDAPAVDALDRLGLSLTNLRRLSPEQQFRAIADAIRDVRDPAQQVQDAMALFGRSGAEILPAIKKGFEDVGLGAVSMSADAVRALDETGDAMGRLWQNTKSLIGEGVGSVLNRLMADYRSLKVLNGEGATETDIFATAQQKLSAVLPPLDNSIKNVSETLHNQSIIEIDLNRQLAAHAEALEKVAAADKIAADAIKEHWGDVGRVLDRVMGVDAVKAATTWLDAIDALGGEMTSFTVEDLGALEAAMLAGIDVMARTGTLTDEQSSRFAALAVQAHQLAGSHAALTSATDTYAKSLYDEAVAQDVAYQAILKTNEAKKSTLDLMREEFESSQRLLNLTGPGVPNIGRSDFEKRISANAGSFASVFYDTMAPPATAPPLFKHGGPTREGPAYLHDDEYVVPKGGALVKSGGSGSGRPIVVNVYYPVMNDVRAADELGRMVETAISQRLSGSI